MKHYLVKLPQEFQMLLDAMEVDKSNIEAAMVFLPVLLIRAYFDGTLDELMKKFMILRLCQLIKKRQLAGIASRI